MKVEVHRVLKKRSLPSFAVTLLLAATLLSLLTSCGQNTYFAGRPLPPSGLVNRVLVAVQNPGPPSSTLSFVDANYDINHPYKNANSRFSIGGYNGSSPATIQNLPEELTGFIYGEGDGSFTPVNYAAETSGTALYPARTPIATSIFVSRSRQYVLSANPSAHSMTIYDNGAVFALNVPGVYRVALNPSATLALGFVQNSNDVYSIFRLTTPQQLQFSTPAAWQAKGYQDCEPQNLPIYCATKVADPGGVFDRPAKALFSADGQSIFVLNCGLECGGTQAGIVTIPVTTSALNGNESGPAGSLLVPGKLLPIPGGATDAIQNSNTLYVAGQSRLPDDLFSGNLTVVDLPSYTVTRTYGISDGTHTKMVFADDNTLWIGSQGCQAGERFALSQTGQNVPFGCLTMFNTAKNSVLVDAYKGDLTGETSVQLLHKVYVAEGGQVHIYNTVDGSERDNSNVTVTGTAYDVAYMDAQTDGDNTTY